MGPCLQRRGCAVCDVVCVPTCLRAVCAVKWVCAINNNNNNKMSMRVCVWREMVKEVGGNFITALIQHPSVSHHTNSQQSPLSFFRDPDAVCHSVNKTDRLKFTKLTSCLVKVKTWHYNFRRYSLPCPWWLPVSQSKMNLHTRKHDSDIVTRPHPLFFRRHLDCIQKKAFRQRRQNMITRTLPGDSLPERALPWKVPPVVERRRERRLPPLQCVAFG